MPYLSAYLFKMGYELYKIKIDSQNFYSTSFHNYLRTIRHPNLILKKKLNVFQKGYKASAVDWGKITEKKCWLTFSYLEPCSVTLNYPNYLYSYQKSAFITDIFNRCSSFSITKVFATKCLVKWIHRDLHIGKGV